MVGLGCGIASHPIPSPGQRRRVHGEAGRLEAVRGQEVGRPVPGRERCSEGARSHCLGADWPVPRRVGALGEGPWASCSERLSVTEVLPFVHWCVTPLLSNKAPPPLHLVAGSDDLLPPWLWGVAGRSLSWWGAHTRAASRWGSAGLGGPHGCRQGWSLVLSVACQRGSLGSVASRPAGDGQWQPPGQHPRERQAGAKGL